MSSDARTLPLRDAPAMRGRVGPGGVLSARARTIVRAERETWLGAIALVLIVAGSAFIVLAATNRPSVLAPTTHANYFPHWMAGPLGGLWPSLTRNPTTLKYLFSGALVAMYAGYLLALCYARQLSARWVFAAIAAVHVLFLLSVPLALTDIFNYVNYGRMEVVHHLNPYTTIPILEPHSDPSYDLSNWHREVVQRRQGVRLHHPRRRRQGPVRTSHRHQRRGLPLAAGGREGLLRPRAGR